MYLFIQWWPENNGIGRQQFSKYKCNWCCYKANSFNMYRYKREEQKTDVWPDKKRLNPEFRKN